MPEHVVTGDSLYQAKRFPLKGPSALELGVRGRRGDLAEWQRPGMPEVPGVGANISKLHKWKQALARSVPVFLRR